MNELTLDSAASDAAADGDSYIGYGYDIYMASYVDSALAASDGYSHFLMLLMLYLLQLILKWTLTIPEQLAQPTCTASPSFGSEAEK